ncbi:hypothetical protein PVAG01_03466 [Phlyctema vagabunda]|uniref:Uncharacterized protein n=1 Tax=Phlyctema vagabunda TaxID=108571 RepID=A0ABR4PLH4_9HELO
MGLFGKKEKSKKQPEINTISQNHLDIPETTNQHPNSTGSGNNSYNESANSRESGISSNISTAETRVHQQPPRQDKSRTVTTVTTTTTTTTTVVDSDGSTQTQTHPYDPSTDPPPQSQTTYQTTTPVPEVDQVKKEDMPAEPIERGRRNSTSGGRPIPERSPMLDRPSPSPVPQRNPLRDSQNIPPLAVNQPPVPPIPEQLRSPVSPSSPVSSNTNYSRPAATPVSRRENLLHAAKGLHGAGEALRGTVNSKLAHGMRDEVEMEKQRVIREQGLKEMRESGFRDKAGDRLRRRSGSQGLRTGGGGLDRVDEAVV